MKNLARAFFAILGTCLVASVLAGPFTPVSVRDGTQAPPAGGGGDSRLPLITPDGRYVLFASLANNLVVINGSNSLPVVGDQKFNVFERDRVLGTTTLVSVNLGGTGGGNGDSIPTAISANGRYALFESTATDLVSNDTNAWTDVFLRDVWSNVTVLISVGTNGWAGNGLSRGSTLTPDGRYVAFASAASNLVSGDINGIVDVFVRDWSNGVTTLASVGAQAPTTGMQVGSESPDISDDGRYVAYYSVATNLVPGVTNSGEIYVRDLAAATTTWVSAVAHNYLGVSAVSFNHMLSADGSFVAYEAVSNSQAAPGFPGGGIFRFSLASGLTDLIYSNGYVPAANFEDFHDLCLTPDGRFIAFVANAISGTGLMIRLWDAQTASNSIVSVDPDGNVPANMICDWPAMDPSGRFVAYNANAQGLVTNALSGDYHLYLADLQAGSTTLVDVDTNGAGSGVSAAAEPQMIADGTQIAFESPDAALVPNDDNHVSDVFVRDLAAGTNELVSAHDSALPSASPNGISALAAQASSADGRWLVFASEADNLLPGVTNGFRNIFVRDLKYGTNLLVSVSTNGGLADGVSSEPAISADGHWAVFSSSADNLVPDDTNNAQDVFVRELPSGPTVLVSVNAAGTGPGNQISQSAVISATGQYVLFQSSSTDLAPGSFSGNNNTFLRDVQLGTTYALTTTGASSNSASSMTPDGRLVVFIDNAGAASGKIYVWDSQSAKRIETNTVLAGVLNLSISPGGNKIACFASSKVVLVDRIAETNGPIGVSYSSGSRASVRFSADGRFLTYAAASTQLGYNQVYLYDALTGNNICLSTTYGTGLAANAISDSPDISADGRYVAFRSFATNLLASSVSNGVPNLYFYDRMGGGLSLLTADQSTGGQPDNRSRTPMFSGDGHTLFFDTWASDLAPLDFNHSGDVMALQFLYATLVLGSGPMLTWPARPGETYQVQYKDNLADPVWLPASGSVTFEGNEAGFTDLAPSAEARFYRVMAF